MNLVPLETSVEEMPYREKLSYLVGKLSEFPQAECPVTHRFAPGVYLREIFMPAGSLVIGKIHKTEHFNILSRGVCTLHHENGLREVLSAPLTFISRPGVQKVLTIHSDTIWTTVHVTPETDLKKLEAELIEPMIPVLQPPQELLA